MNKVSRQTQDGAKLLSIDWIRVKSYSEDV